MYICELYIYIYRTNNMKNTACRVCVRRSPDTFSTTFHRSQPGTSREILQDSSQSFYTSGFVKSSRILGCKIGAEITITNTALGVPCYSYSIMGPKTLFQSSRPLINPGRNIRAWNLKLQASNKRSTLNSDYNDKNL